MTQDSLSIASSRLLASLDELSKEGYQATMKGFSKILRGVDDQETVVLRASDLFGSYPSLSSKRIISRLHALVRKGYLALTYSEEDEDYYLSLTPKSLAVVAKCAWRQRKDKPDLKRKRSVRPLETTSIKGEKEK